METLAEERTERDGPARAVAAKQVAVVRVEVGRWAEAVSAAAETVAAKQAAVETELAVRRAAAVSAAVETERPQ